MVKDTSGGDTTGIYYKIIVTPGTTDTLLTYASDVSFVFTLRSFDGKYASTDTIANHYQGYVGHVTEDALPSGLQLALVNDLKYKGGSMRLLIPSRLAYGIGGYGSGSTEVASTHIAGNQCLDYYVHVIGNQATYDYTVIQNYLAANSLTSLYTLDSGVYYRVTTKGTGTDAITDNSTIEISRNGRLLNGSVFDADFYGVDTTSVEVPNLPLGAQRTLRNHATKGTVISMIMPSYLGFGQSSGTNLPVNSCLRYEYTVVDVSP